MGAVEGRRVSIVHAKRSISHDSKLHLTDFETPVWRTNVETTAHWSEWNKVVKLMGLIVVQNHYVILEKVLNVLFGVQIEPVFKSKTIERLKHLFLCEKVDLLCFLGVSFRV